MRAAYATIAVCLFVQAAVADDVPKPAPDPQAEARVQRIIASTEHGTDVFRADEFGNVIHIASGMECAAVTGRLERLVVAPSAPFGDQAGCIYTFGARAKISVAIHRLGAQNFNDYATVVDTAIRKEFPEAGQPTAVMALAHRLMPPCKTAKYPLIVSGEKAFTSVWMFEEAGWVIEVHATYRAVGALAPEMVAAAACFAAQGTIRTHGASP